MRWAGGAALLLCAAAEFLWSTGVSATDVTPSEATGAAVEPVRLSSDGGCAFDIKWTKVKTFERISIDAYNFGVTLCPTQTRAETFAYEKSLKRKHRC